MLASVELCVPVTVTVDELVPLVRAVSGAAKRSLVVADFPFGSYEQGPEQALTTGIRFMKEGLAQAVKLEGGRAFAPQVKALTTAGIPVMGHIGCTPQSEHMLGGYRVLAPRGIEVDVNTIGKAATWILYLAIGCRIVTHAHTAWPLDLFWAGVGLALVAAMLYVARARGELRS